MFIPLIQGKYMSVKPLAGLGVDKVHDMDEI